MIEGFEKDALVIVNLVNPKEKFFGMLRSVSGAGVTMKAVNLDSFEDWIHQIARNEEPDIEMITTFVPLFRVERISLDEPVGTLKSYGQRFREVAGMTVAEHLGTEASGSV